MTIDLEFASIEQAQSLLATMRQVWAGVGSTVMTDPTARIFETVETKEL